MSKPKFYLTVGVSASGKTTWANEQLKNDEQNGISTININRDDIRFNHVLPGSNWTTYKFTKARETEVSEIALQQFNNAVEMNYNIIVSDTNLNPTYRDAWINRAIVAGYEVIIKEFPITLEEAWKRDAARGNGVGQTTIYQQYKLWQEYIGVKKYVPAEYKPKAIIVDVDGTIANRVGRNPFEWEKVGQDSPRSFIIDMITNYCKYYKTHNLVFLSGRDSICRQETIDWIAEHFNLPKDGVEIYMRAEGDMRKDTVIKEELFWEHIEPTYNVIGAFDDRPVIVRLWHTLGIPNVICVSDPYIEF